jgi:hypothetical protein
MTLKELQWQYDRDLADLLNSTRGWPRHVYSAKRSKLEIEFKLNKLEIEKATAAIKLPEA